MATVVRVAGILTDEERVLGYVAILESDAVAACVAEMDWGKVCEVSGANARVR